MRRNLLSAAILGAVLALVVRPGQSYDAAAFPARHAVALARVIPAQPAATPAKEPDRSRVRRLPSYYGQIGLSDPQRQAIYRLQEAYSEQIDALEKQLETLKARRDQEIENVLTAAQKQRLGALTEAAAKRRAARSSSTAAKPPAPGKQP
jgi:hypothetical protein